MKNESNCEEKTRKENHMNGRFCVLKGVGGSSLKLIDVHTPSSLFLISNQSKQASRKNRKSQCPSFIQPKSRWCSVL